MAAMREAGKELKKRQKTGLAKWYAVSVSAMGSDEASEVAHENDASASAYRAWRQEIALSDVGADLTEELKETSTDRVAYVRFLLELKIE